jgi:hypothetical protein
VETHKEDRLKKLVRRDPDTGKLFINIIELSKPFLGSSPKKDQET